MAKIFFTDGSEKEVSPKNGSDFSLEEMQGIVGGYIQMLYLDNGELMVVNEEGKLDISWDYAVEPVIESYHVVGENTLPSIGEIYDVAATWPERELNEIFGVEFEGLDMSQRLFLPESMLETEGKGQIMVVPLSELRAKNIKEEN